MSYYMRHLETYRFYNKFNARGNSPLTQPQVLPLQVKEDLHMPQARFFGHLNCEEWL
jgi:hypothetical protein